MTTSENRSFPSNESADAVKIVETATEPRPTIAPAALAFGIMLVPWGILTHWIVSLAGFCVMCWAIAKWIDELRKEWSKHDRD